MTLSTRLLSKRAFRSAQYFQQSATSVSSTARLQSNAPSHQSSSSSASSSSQNAAAFDAQNSYTRDPFSLIHRKARSPVVAHAVSPRRTVPDHLNIPSPPYAKLGVVMPSLFPERVILHSETSVARMRTAARLARRVLDYACSLAEVGRTTDEIDCAVHDEIIGAGAYPSPLNYAGFPKSLCSSVNEVICHGIPDSRTLEAGDVVSFDVSCFIGGVHGDNCATVIVGDRDDRKEAKEGVATDWRGVPHKTKFASSDEEELFMTGRRLVQATLESLNEGVEACRPGGCLTDIGAAIHAVADAYGYDTVQKYRGHGIGEEFHCSPFVKHYRNSDKLRLEPGMIFTIEPMLTEGSRECFEWDDAWTVVTRDGGRAAQFEHTVLITDTGVEILTVPE